MGTVLLIYLSLQFSSHTYHCSSLHIPLITVLSMTLPTSPCLLLLLIVVSPALSECPEGWKLMGDSCYLIGDRHMNWFAAQQVTSLLISSLIGHPNSYLDFYW